MKLYAIEVKLCATLYVKAKSRAAAWSQAQGLIGETICTDGSEPTEVTVSALSFTDPELPDLSLSPMMTCHGVWEGSPCEVIEQGLPGSS